MNELSELVEQLEDPEIEPEAALVLYEKGVQLAAVSKNAGVGGATGRSGRGR